MYKRNWMREELILAFNLYLKLPFGKMHSRTPEIIHLANLIARTPSSVAMRLTNFAHIDPYHQQRGITGISGGKNQVQPIWDEFSDNKERLIFESEKILAEKEHTTLEEKFTHILEDIKDLQGEIKIREVKTRVNQNVFRQIVISNYSSKCAITGIDIPALLVASHIIPWSKNERERLNPENGICLSALYDKAFDKGFIGLNKSYEVIISPHLKKKTEQPYYKRYFAHIEKIKINLPQRYLPKQEFLEYHLDVIFEKE
jgi:putative restriction endonuclease